MVKYVPITEKEFEFLQTSCNKEESFQGILNETLSNLKVVNESEVNKENAEKYVASMLLCFAVKHHATQELKIFLLKEHKADPKMKDVVTELSALVLALLQEDLPTIKLFGNCGNDGLERISDDCLTLGSIDFAVTGEHEYDEKVLLEILSHLYTDIYDYF